MPSPGAPAVMPPPSAEAAPGGASASASGSPGAPATESGQAGPSTGGQGVSASSEGPPPAPTTSAPAPVPSSPPPPRRIRPANRNVELFNDQIFCELRAYAQVPDEFIDTGWDLSTLSAGGGKGGSEMARVGSSYIVKELSKGDHKTLLKIAGSYGNHVRTGDTLLCPIYLHFRDLETGRYFFAMRNSVGHGPFSALYDLKGCADDKTMELHGQRIPAVHKRIWKCGMWCGKSSWTPERHRYYDGKVAARKVSIACTPDQRARLLGCMRRDVAWMQRHRLMDYSLLVATKPYETSTATGGKSPSVLGHGMVLKKTDGTEEQLFVSIIDFLQLWTSGKRLARCIKLLERNKATVPPVSYGERFCRNFEERFSACAAPPEAVSASNGAPPHVPRPVAPPAGDVDMEGSPEDRLQTPSNSRPHVEERLNSRSMPQALAPSPEEKHADGPVTPVKQTLEM